MSEGPLVLHAPIGSEALLQQELWKVINEAVATSARVTKERERTQAVLGQAIVGLSQVRAREQAFVPDLTKYAAVSAQGRRESLEGVFKLPSNWRGTEFRIVELKTEAMAQQELGRMITAHSFLSWSSAQEHCSFERQEPV